MTLLVRYRSCNSHEQSTALTGADEQATNTTCGIEDTSGSGKGYFALSKRTVAKELVYVGNSPIGKGRYGEVWRGKFKGREVAIKQFPSTEEESFYRESEIYDSLMLRHPVSLILICRHVLNRKNWSKVNKHIPDVTSVKKNNYTWQIPRIRYNSYFD